MTEPSSAYRSWNRPATPEEVAAHQRVERRRNWIRPASIVVVIAVVLLDGLALLAGTGVQSALRSGSRVPPCSTFWSGLAHDTLTSLWIVVGLVAVTLLVAARWRWILVAVVVVQVVLLAIAVPSLLHKRQEFLDVGAGRLSVTQVDTNGVTCK